MQARINREWGTTCVKSFLLETIEIIQPRVVVTLGREAYLAVLAGFGVVVPKIFRDAVEREGGFNLSKGIRWFPVYHCGNRVLNTHRRIESQREDWKRIGTALGRRSPG